MFCVFAVVRFKVSPVGYPQHLINRSERNFWKTHEITSNAQDASPKPISYKSSPIKSNKPHHTARHSEIPRTINYNTNFTSKPTNQIFKKISSQENIKQSPLKAAASGVISVQRSPFGRNKSMADVLKLVTPASKIGEVPIETKAYTDTKRVTKGTWLRQHRGAFEY